ncbi:DNA ligase D [Chitinophaga sp. SYP-B3965]|uniref:DNA ligase D n=1 Tax=Chitinophaga sp. SYP-B3965 TaxID=2663120 RepID=UPI001299AFA4|nr:DNA ligase D [Chitinophaga sp. SYP-B3965]MRG46665.1 DNA ligase D [Chitinophaga sp. SYP-B3965]
MLATLVDEPFDREGWIFETKWDGYRAIAQVQDGAAELYSRNQLSFNKVYAPIKAAVEKIPHNVVLDGEVVILGANNYTDFQALQNYKSTGKGKLTYEVFDLLHLDGHDLKELTLIERKTLLQELVKQLDDPLVRYSAHVADKGNKLFEKAQKDGWEGIIAKNGASDYVEGTRTLNWLKMKILNRQEVIICGYTEPRGSRKKIGALILGVYEKSKLRYVGHCGGGFNDQGLNDMHALLQKYKQEDSPFAEKVKTNTAVTWLKPELVCEVKFAGWTEDGILRQPIFVALREDKAAKSVKQEKPIKGKTMATKTVTKAAAKVAAKKTKGSVKASAAERSDISLKGGKAMAAKRSDISSFKGGKAKTAKVAADKSSKKENDRTLLLNKQSVVLTNQQKIYWPQEKITKGQLVDYYMEVADHLLPHLKDRPLSLHRFPNGITGMSFYQKDMDVKTIPSWLKTVSFLAESTGKEVDYLLCNDKATLAYMINLGCIEVNPWLSRISKPEHPDNIVIDLDPEGIPFSAVVETAQCVHEILKKFGINSYCKTSGSRGLHIFIPTGAKYEYDTCRLFAEFIARETNAQLPGITSVVRTKSQRKKKVYVDFLQNSHGQTIAAPYSVRPKPGATVSTPLDWKEVNEKLNIKDFHIGNTVSRLKKKGDLWANIYKDKNDLKAVLKKQVK